MNEIIQYAALMGLVVIGIGIGRLVERLVPRPIAHIHFHGHRERPSEQGLSTGYPAPDLARTLTNVGKIVATGQRGGFPQ